MGTTVPNFKVEVVDSANSGIRVQTSTAGGTVASFGGSGAFQIDSAGTAGGRFTVLENGNVGVGNSNPQTKFQITPPSGQTINFGSGLCAGPNITFISFGSGNCGGYALSNYSGTQINRASGQSIVFSEGHFDLQMFLSPGGRLGIGAGSSTYKLLVFDSSNFGLRVQNSTAGGTVASFGGNGDFNIDLGATAGGRFVVKENGRVGIGTSSPSSIFNVIDASNTGLRVQTNIAGGTVASFGGNGNFVIDAPGNAGGRLKVLENGNVGIGMAALDNVNNKLDVVGTIGVWTLNSGGSVPLCWHTGGFNLSTCGSSERYKKNQKPFAAGMDILMKLRPIAFDWKEGGTRDLGLGAEEVAAIEPLLVTYNKDGQIEGVKYDRIGVVLVNAIKEQQIEIEMLKKELKTQQDAVAEFKAILCSKFRKSKGCQKNN